ncbi:MAG: hypothetical protein AAFV96_02710 [Pseudomonadota bacterium]
MSRATAACLIVLAAAPLQASQPISTSLMECGAIFDELADIAARRGRSAADIEKADKAAWAFREAALIEAEREGRAAEALDPVGVAMAKKWDGRFTDVLRLGENKDWIDYCNALGKDRGVLPIE